MTGFFWCLVGIALGLGLGRYWFGPAPNEGSAVSGSSGEQEPSVTDVAGESTEKDPPAIKELYRRAGACSGQYGASAQPADVLSDPKFEEGVEWLLRDDFTVPQLLNSHCTELPAHPPLASHRDGPLLVTVVVQDRGLPVMRAG